LRCDHPDILEFVAAKSDGDLRNFNISVALTDGFVAAYEADSWYDLVDPRDGCVVGRILARQLLDEICWEAWHTGDPGLLFIDRINADNPTPLLGKIEATNPCGEAPLLPFEACCLGGINVAAFANKEGEDLDWTGLRQLAGNALHMMDNVIEASRFPLKEIDTAVRRTRKVGIGVMGFADLLIARGIPYDSAEAEALAGRLMATIQSATREMSMHLAMERGPFPAYDGSRWQQSGGPPLRNATVTSNAPNSTISVIAGCSPGIEPLFSLAYIKQLANGEQLREVNPALIGALREHELLNPHLLAKIESAGSIKSMTELPANLRRIFVTAYDIAPATHVRIQAAFQKYTDLGVSKTINLPQDATVDNVKDAFLLAYALGCKGITCYRDGCQETQFLTTMSGQSKHDKAAQCPECAIGG
jgi:ribonucleoside-diphosphate reductase alpha chain